MATNYYDSFTKKLQEIFMMDHAELDFGIYRIMNQKRAEIEHFLKFELLPQVKTALAGAPDGSDNEVFSHLVTFFSRYYDNGDFISKRRYKDNTYAIPYNGEEVKLHWANADQYYIKSSEYFRDYTFVLPTSRRKVHFVLKDASTEQNKNKAANNMERRFALYKPENEEELFYEENGEELNIFFTYELMPKATKQNDLLAEALDKISEIVPEPFSELLTVKSPTDKNANRTLLEKHLTDYTAKNSFDYFIHKDLGGFLRRELDFYIKNEVMLLDDLDAQHIASQLNIIKAIKTVGEKIIRMLAQLEDFQKKLWLKKKFVVQCDYCITLDRVPRELYPEILANDRQREEWVRLFAIDEIKGDMMAEGYSEPLTMEFLNQNPFLVLDTVFFSQQFKHKLLAHLGDKGIDKQCNGLLIHSDNFQGLQFLQEKYFGKVDCVYIDPPYNTNATPILYKNSYKDSSWMTLIADRVCLSKRLVSNYGYHSVAIDDAELHNLYKLLESCFYGNDIFQCIVNHYPGSGTGRSNVSKTHEYNLFVLPKDLDLLRGDQTDARERTRGFCRSGTGDNNHRYGRPNSFYAVLIDDTTKEIKGVEPPPAADDTNYPKGKDPNGWLRIYPLGADGTERCWSLGYETAKVAISNGMIKCSQNNTIHRLYNDESDWELLPSLWVDPKYSAVTYGTNLLTKILGKSGLFSFPKSLYTVMRSVYAGTYLKDDANILDYFGGSGTTAHAVININKEFGGNRKYILCEMGSYFDNVTRTRVEKVIYSDAYEDGKPVSRQGISQCFKYMRLEQYEDTLNNLELKQQQTSAQFEDGSSFKESFVLSYMLDVETRDSLLNLKMFENPFAMTLKTTKDNELVETPVDMVETFNYLIGLNVETEDWYRGENICVVQGYTHRDNLHTLVIWRNCKEIDNEQLNQFFERMDFRTRDSEFDLIYVNGDNTLPNLRRDEDNWKVVLIEEEFTKRMFETE